MEIAFALLFLGSIIGAGIAWRRKKDRDAAEAPRDDTLRAGSAQSSSPEGASRRAEGNAAWMRPSF